MTPNFRLKKAKQRLQDKCGIRGPRIDLWKGGKMGKKRDEIVFVEQGERVEPKGGTQNGREFQIYELSPLF